MKRILLALMLVSLFAQGAPVAQAGVRSHAVSVISCQPTAGQFAAEGTIRPIRGARKLVLRFDLQRRAPGASAYERVPIGDPDSNLGKWQTFPASSTWHVRERVKNIQLPGAYRMRVGFRWYGTHGRILKRTTDATRGCNIPDRRPNLRIVGVEVTPLDATHDNYAVTFRNAGLAATPLDVPFAMTLDFSAGAPLRHEVKKPLAGHAQRTVIFSGPRCTTLPAPIATADADDTVVERDESDNSFTVECPTP